MLGFIIGEKRAKDAAEKSCSQQWNNIEQRPKTDKNCNSPIDSQKRIYIGLAYTASCPDLSVLSQQFDKCRPYGRDMVLIETSEKNKLVETMVKLYQSQLVDCKNFKNEREEYDRMKRQKDNLDEERFKLTEQLENTKADLKRYKRVFNMEPSRHSSGSKTPPDKAMLQMTRTFSGSRSHQITPTRSPPSALDNFALNIPWSPGEPSSVRTSFDLSEFSKPRTRLQSYGAAGDSTPPTGYETPSKFDSSGNSPPTSSSRKSKRPPPLGVTSTSGFESFHTSGFESFPTGSSDGQGRFSENSQNGHDTTQKSEKRNIRNGHDTTQHNIRKVTSVNFQRVLSASQEVLDKHRRAVTSPDLLSMDQPMHTALNNLVRSPSKKKSHRGSDSAYSSASSPGKRNRMQPLESGSDEDSERAGTMERALGGPSLSLEALPASSLIILEET